MTKSNVIRLRIPGTRRSKRELVFNTKKFMSTLRQLLPLLDGLLELMTFFPKTERYAKMLQTTRAASTKPVGVEALKTKLRRERTRLKSMKKRKEMSPEKIEVQQEIVYSILDELLAAMA